MKRGKFEHRGARFALGGLAMVLVFVLAIAPSASARELAPPPAEGGLVENPDGTWSLYREGGSTPLKVYSSAEHETLLKLDAGLDLDTGTTGQGASDVEGIDAEEVEADHRMAERLRTGKAYVDVGEAEVGDQLVEQDQALGTLPENDTLFNQCDSTPGCAFRAGAVLIGLKIGDGTEDLLGLPHLGTTLNSATEGPKEAERATGIMRSWMWLPEIKFNGAPFSCEASSHKVLHIYSGQCMEVQMPFRSYTTYLYEGGHESQEISNWVNAWSWPWGAFLERPTACPAVPMVICEIQNVEPTGYGPFGEPFPTHTGYLYLWLDGNVKQMAFPAVGLAGYSTTTEEVPPAPAQKPLSTPVKVSAIPPSREKLEQFIGFENETGLLPGIEGPRLPDPFLEWPWESEDWGLGGSDTPDRHGCYSGWPVNCATGNEVQTQTDLSVGGRGPALGLALTYNSALAANQTQPDTPAPGVFGYGWTGSYSAHLELGYESKAATVYQDDGSTAYFVRSGEHWTASAPDVQATLASEGSGYVYTLPDQTALHFNSTGKLTSEVDRNGNTLTMSYNSEGRLESVKDGAGREITFKYNSEGHVESASDPMSRIVKYTYEGGNLASVTEPGETNPRWQYKYNSSHELTSETDGRDYTTTTEYNAANQVISQTDPLHRTRKWQYAASTSGTETTITEPDGAITVEQFNEYGSPTSVTHAAGTSLAATTTDSYNSADELTASTNPDGETTEYGYDSAGDLTSEKNPDGDETKWEYDSTHDVTGVTTPLGEKTTIERDGHGNAIKVSRPAPGETTQTTKYKYDSHGDLESMTDPLGHEWKYEYNSYGDRTAEIDPEGNKRTWGYNEDSQETSMVSPRGHVSGAKESSFTTTIERDTQGRPTAVINPLKDKTEYTYNADGELATETDPEGNKTTYTYDEDDEPIKVEEPNKTTTETEYNSEGQVTAQTDGDKHTTKYERNALGEVSEEINPLTQKTTKEYDKAGNLVSITDAEKRTTSYKYDPAGRLIEVSYSDGKTPTVKYEYNADGTRTKMTDGIGESVYTYDQLQRLIESKDGHGDTVKYEYNLANNPTKITYPNGKSITRAYDNDERLKSVTDWLEHTTKFSYSPDSELSASMFPTGTSDEDIYAYDDADAMSEVTMKKGSETLASLVYTRDKDGGVTKATSKGLPGEEKPAFSYDENSRLTKGAGTKYAYDDANNPTTIGEDTYAYNSADELEKSTLKKTTIATYTYNEVGQRTKTTPASLATSYGYDQAGNLTTVTRVKEGETPAIEDTYAYNGEGLRASQTISATTSYLTWDMAEELPLILNDGNSSYIYGPGDIPVEQISSSGTVTYLHHDQAGSTRLLTGSAGTVTGKCTYGPYGTPTCEGTTTTPLGYDGQYTSSDTGLVYLRNRVYDPATAQFLTVDPLVSISGAPYNYAGDNPLTYGDAVGLLWTPLAGGAGGADAACGATIEIPGVDIGTCGAAGIATGAAAVGAAIGVVTAVAGNEGGDEGEAELKKREAERESCGNPASSPGSKFEWKGNGPVGSNEGSWWDPGTDESLHPDLGHAEPIGPHYDYEAPDGSEYRIYPDGRIEPTKP